MRSSLIAAFVVALLAGCSSGVTTSSDKQFVGSEKCKSCHANEYTTCKGTLHSKMIRTAKDGLLKDAGDNWAKDSKGNAGPTKANISIAGYKCFVFFYQIYNPLAAKRWRRLRVTQPASII